ncbi:MAG TPA: hypothetical protein PKA48_10515, partial [Candidatus Obscuribacter sp.]|nr:hypothetical protein [Candidatus Obscuribacter sp.]
KKEVTIKLPQKTLVMRETSDEKSRIIGFLDYSAKGMREQVEDLKSYGYIVLPYAIIVNGRRLRPGLVKIGRFGIPQSYIDSHAVRKVPGDKDSPIILKGVQKADQPEKPSKSKTPQTSPRPPNQNNNQQNEIPKTRYRQSRSAWRQTGSGKGNASISRR